MTRKALFHFLILVNLLLIGLVQADENPTLESLVKAIQQAENQAIPP